MTNLVLLSDEKSKHVLSCNPGNRASSKHMPGSSSRCVSYANQNQQM